MNNESTATVIAFLGEFMDFLQAKEAAKKPVVETATAVEPVVEHDTSVNIPENFVTVKEFIKLSGLPAHQVRIFARENEGSAAIKKPHNGRYIWMLDSEAAAVFKKQGHSRRPIGCRCVELNRDFRSITSASAETKVDRKLIRDSMKTGKKVGGYHFSAAV